MAIRDVVSAAAVFLFAGAAFYLAGDYGERAGMFPRLVAGIMMGAAVLLFVRGLFSRPAESSVNMVTVRRTAVAIVLTLLYVAAIVPVGYVTSSVVFMLATMYLLGMRHYAVPAVVTVAFVFVLYYAFENIFHAPLPDELLLKLLGTAGHV